MKIGFKKNTFVCFCEDFFAAIASLQKSIDNCLLQMSIAAKQGSCWVILL